MPVATAMILLVDMMTTGIIALVMVNPQRSRMAMMQTVKDMPAVSITGLGALCPKMNKVFLSK
jgi:hypothetical protein